MEGVALAISKIQKLDTLDILEIARAKKNSKTLSNRQLKFSISPLLKLAMDCI